MDIRHLLNDIKQQSTDIEHVEKFGTMNTFFFCSAALKKKSVCRLKTALGELETVDANLASDVLRITL
ncbi:hypothetical protein DPMN_156450 [Dreissena polymorpha]|uniref:Uncharacterized protein n=1 Tax=Dreissena polymorpha TaxID=45954 RepID=A0A9D4FQS1_DREPO|nr:hypothetical protein DPMN_156450 [Dreissena polymorpha]